MKHFIYICFLLLIILLFSWINSSNNIENFTPGIRQFYRPIIRNTRLITEGFYNKTTTNISNFLRKFSII